MTAEEFETLSIKRVIPAKKERLFRAWTQPEELRKWWTIGEGWRAEFAEIDLRVGGKFMVGNKPRRGELVLLSGEFLKIEPPDRLVYAWQFGPTIPGQSVITVEFREVGDGTEVSITHERSPKSMGPAAVAGWESILEGLYSFIE